MLVKMNHPTIGELPLVGSPFKMSDTPVEYRLPPPLMGEHTDEVLRELGYEGDGRFGFKLILSLLIPLPAAFLHYWRI